MRRRRINKLGPLWILLALGGMLRAIPLLYPMPQGDGVIRLREAIQWAYQPTWYGLGGQWPPLTMYFQGFLIRYGADPIWLAYLMGYITSVLTLYAVYRLCLLLFENERIALYGLFFASIYWQHIIIVNMNLSENFYTLLLIIYLFFMIKIIKYNSSSLHDILYAMAALGGLLLIRHEGRIVWLATLLYIAYHKKYKLFLITIMLGGLLLFYLLFENWWMHGHLLADIRSARENFIIAEKLAGAHDTILKKILGLEILMYQPSIFIIALIFIGIYNIIKTKNIPIQFLIWIVQFYLLFMILSFLISPLRVYWRYFIPILMLLLPFAGFAFYQMRRRSIASAFLLGTIIIQPTHWFYSQSVNLGKYSVWHLLPVTQPSPQQKTLEQQITQLPRGVTLYVFYSFPAQWDVEQAALNTRRYDLIPRLHVDQRYNQYKLYLETINLSKENIKKADFLLVDPSYPRLTQLIQNMPKANIVYQTKFILIYKINRRPEMYKQDNT
jgi:hypothetical protein